MIYAVARSCRLVRFTVSGRFAVRFTYEIEKHRHVLITRLLFRDRTERDSGVVKKPEPSGNRPIRITRFTRTRIRSDISMRVRDTIISRTRTDTCAADFNLSGRPLSPFLFATRSPHRRPHPSLPPGVKSPTIVSFSPLFFSATRRRGPYRRRARACGVDGVFRLEIDDGGNSRFYPFGEGLRRGWRR